MFDALLADGIAGGAGERLATYAVKCLAVAGGFLLGYWGGKGVAWALDRWVFAQKAPDLLKRAVSIAAGVALAILVALIVFGEGGVGLFGRGGGSGEGKGQPVDDTKGKTAPTPPEAKKDEPAKKNEPKLPPPPPTPGDVRVAILSGDDVRDGKFYSFDDDPTPRNFEEFKRYILDRKKATKTELTIIFRYKKEPLADNDPQVVGTLAWVNQQKLLNRFE